MKSITGRRYVVVLCLSVLLATTVQRLVGQELGITNDVDPHKVVGHEQCNKCHESEVKAWAQSNHAKTSFDLLKTNDAKQFAAKLNIASAVDNADCRTCHETHKQGTRLNVISCESCHSHAGPEGQGGWLAVHGDLGIDVANPKWADRDKETEAHLAGRHKKMDELKMRRPENLYALAKNCFECHHVGSEKLVNQGGHPAGETGETGFEFYSWSQGEVRHNFQRDPNVNAEVASVWLHARGKQGRTVDGRKRLMYVVGHLAGLEVSLRNRASAKEAGKFLTTANQRIQERMESLSSMRRARIDEVRTLIKDIEDQLADLNNLKPDDLKKYTELAEIVAKAGNAVAAGTGDGGRWERLELPSAVKGKAP